MVCQMTQTSQSPSDIYSQDFDPDVRHFFSSLGAVAEYWSVIKFRS